MTTNSLLEAITFRIRDNHNDATSVVDACCESFLTHEAAIINNEFSTEFLAEVNRAYQATYGNFINPRREVGDKRTILQAPFTYAR